LILDKVLGVAVKLFEETLGLRGRAILEDALKDSASVRVGSEGVDLSDASVGNEGNLVARNSLERTLKEGRSARERRDSPPSKLT